MYTPNILSFKSMNCFAQTCCANIQDESALPCTHLHLASPTAVTFLQQRRPRLLQNQQMLPCGCLGGVSAAQLQDYHCSMLEEGPSSPAWLTTETVPVQISKGNLPTWKGKIMHTCFSFLFQLSMGSCFWLFALFFCRREIGIPMNAGIPYSQPIHYCPLDCRFLLFLLSVLMYCDNMQSNRSFWKKRNLSPCVLMETINLFC